MRINQDECVACLECIDYCPVEAIKEDPAKGEVFIDEEECVECGCCLKADVCPCEAIWQPELDWRRRLRAEFSDASVPHPLTGVRGRGTEEMKTNDVTARYPRGRAGIAAELGLSVIVSGLHDETDRLCREAGTRRHTVQYSLGVWGKTELLPHPKILEITTMCGHGTIPFNLVRRMSKAVRSKKLSLEQAAALGKPCVCGIFNTSRAQALLQEYIACTEDE